MTGNLPNIHPIFINFTIGLFTLAFLAYWQGSGLVFRHGLGVLSLPTPEGVAEHQHHDVD